MLETLRFVSHVKLRVEKACLSNDSYGRPLGHFNKRTMKFHSLMRQNGVFRVGKKLLRYCKALEEERRKKKEERKKEKEKEKEKEQQS